MICRKRLPFTQTSTNIGYARLEVAPLTDRSWPVADAQYRRILHANAILQRIKAVEVCGIKTRQANSKDRRRTPENPKGDLSGRLFPCSPSTGKSEAPKDFVTANKHFGPMKAAGVSFYDETAMLPIVVKAAVVQGYGNAEDDFDLAFLVGNVSG